MKKIIKMLLALMIIAVPITVMATKAEATKITKYTSSLYTKEELPLLLRFTELDQNTKHVYHKYNGKEYPAYCLNETLQGITSDNQYEVTVEDEITDIKDIGLWRIIVNGYPYKTIKELGCESEQEAYTATQHAIYCYLRGDTGVLNLYTPVRQNEAASRTLEALKTIITNATNSQEMPSEQTHVYYGKAPNSDLQNYALTKIVEEKTKEEPIQEKIQEPIQKIEKTKLPKTGN